MLSSQTSTRAIASPEPIANNRRGSDRKVVRLRASVSLPGDRTFEAHTVDISSGGACIVAPYQLTAGQQCVIHLELSACGSDHKMQLVGRVCYCNRSGTSQFRVGMRFVQLDDTAASFVAAILS
jgi:c-di-GMP-binding flagellar brake protein YcgR